MKLPKRGSWVAKTAMVIFGNSVIAVIFFALLGAIGGGLASPYANNGQVALISVGTIWGWFIGVIFVAREDPSGRWCRRAVRVLVGAAAGAGTGVILGWSHSSSVALALGFAVLGYFGHVWAKHLTFP